MASLVDDIFKSTGEDTQDDEMLDIRVFQRTLFPKKETQYSFQRIMNCSQSQSKNQLIFVNKEIDKKTNITFCFKTSLDSQKNCLKASCRGMHKGNYITIKTNQLAAMLSYNLLRVSCFYGESCCFCLIDENTKQIKGKSEIFIEYKNYRKKKQEVMKKIISIQYFLKKTFIIVLKLINQLPDNLPLKIYKDLDKRQKQVEDRIFNCLQNSILEVFKETNLQKSEEDIFQENLSSLLEKQNSPVLEKDISDLYYLPIFQECSSYIRLYETEMQKQRRLVYLQIPKTKKVIEKQYIYNDVLLAEPKNVTAKRSTFQSGTNEMLISKINFFYINDENSKSIEKVKRDEKLCTKFVVIKIPKSEIFKKKNDHQINILKLFKSVSSQYLLQYYKSSQEQFKYKNNLMVDLTLSYSNMDSIIKKKNPSFFVRVFILVNIVQIIRFLKMSSVVHMDLSFGNILMNNHYSVKFIDFGESYSQKVCNPNYNHGFTLPFVFPERFRNLLTYTSKSDMFSFSVIAFYTIFSSFPYRSTQLISRLSKGTYLKKFFFVPEACSYVGYEKVVMMLLAFIVKGMSFEQHKRPHPSKSIIILKDLFYWIQDWLCLFYDSL